MDTTNLVNDILCWNGPAFLLNGAGDWPDLPTKFDLVEADKELMKNIPDVTHSLIAVSREDRTSVNLEQIMKIRNFVSRIK